eukprot:Nitzschia sp. Nitz4//scaffold314_size20990//12434//17650//NITZ4_008632-RA/size20990-augustus-gene-0.25-mRNA-1//-1//CDS//3329547473//5397//frame0
MGNRVGGGAFVLLPHRRAGTSPTWVTWLQTIVTTTYASISSSGGGCQVPSALISFVVSTEVTLATLHWHLINKILADIMSGNGEKRDKEQKKDGKSGGPRASTLVSKTEITGAALADAPTEPPAVIDAFDVNPPTAAASSITMESSMMINDSADPKASNRKPRKSRIAQFNSKSGSDSASMEAPTPPGRVSEDLNASQEFSIGAFALGGDLPSGAAVRRSQGKPALTLRPSVNETDLSPQNAMHQDDVSAQQAPYTPPLPPSTDSSIVVAAQLVSDGGVDPALEARLRAEFQREADQIKLAAREEVLSKVVKAEVISMDDSEQPSQAKAGARDSQGRSRNAYYVLGALLVLVGIVVAVVVVLLGKDDDGTAPNGGTNTDDNVGNGDGTDTDDAVGNTDDGDNVLDLRSILEQITSDQILDDASTPQFMAWSHIASEYPSLDLSDKLAVRQLYIITSFWYSTGGNRTWDYQPGFMSSPNVCDWHDDNWVGVICDDNDENRVEHIILPYNDLQGSLPSELSYLSSLVSLNLGYNSLTGTIPPFSVDSLMHIYLQDNQLTGSIPSSLAALPYLESLNLYENELEGKIPPFGNATSLRIISIEANANLYGSAEEVFGNFPPSLAQFWCSYCSLSGTLPGWAFSQLTNLDSVWLYDTPLNGTIPDELFDAPLQNLGLSENFLSGTIPSSIGTCTSLSYVEITSTGIEGTVPTEIGRLTSLSVLSLGWNSLTGPLPQAIASLKALGILAVEGNHLSGTIPVFDGGALTSLYLGYNEYMTGDVEEIFWAMDPDIFEEFSCDGCELSGNLSNVDFSLFHELSMIDITNCRVGGTLDTIAAATNIDTLSFYGNNFTGTIPPQIGQMSRLEYLGLGENQLSGEIPPFDGASLSSLDVSANYLLTGDIGDIIMSLDSELLLELHADWNGNISGTLPEELSLYTLLQELSVSYNQIIGTIPSGLSSLTDLEYLDLSGNSMTGTIPRDLADMESMKTLQLYDNGFIDDINDDFCPRPYSTIDVDCGSPVMVAFTSSELSSVSRMSYCAKYIVSDLNNMRYLFVYVGTGIVSVAWGVFCLVQWTRPKHTKVHLVSPVNGSILEDFEVRFEVRISDSVSNHDAKLLLRQESDDLLQEFDLSEDDGSWIVDVNISSGVGTYEWKVSISNWRNKEFMSGSSAFSLVSTQNGKPDSSDFAPTSSPSHIMPPSPSVTSPAAVYPTSSPTLFARKGAAPSTLATGQPSIQQRNPTSTSSGDFDDVSTLNSLAPTSSAIVNGLQPECHSVDPTRYNICLDLQFSTSAKLSAFVEATSAWESIIVGHTKTWRDVGSKIMEGWSQNDVWATSVPNTIDDMYIAAFEMPIDGKSEILGYAAPMLVASSTGLPLTGKMVFDSADLEWITDEKWQETILHEMGHVLGLGGFWMYRGLINEITEENGRKKYIYNGQHAQAEWEALGCTDALPIEGDFGEGTAGAHFDESCLGKELMTGFLMPNVTSTISRITIASLEDLGYQVSYEQAGEFSIADLDLSVCCNPSHRSLRGKKARRPKKPLSRRLYEIAADAAAVELERMQFEKSTTMTEEGFEYVGGSEIRMLMVEEGEFHGASFSWEDVQHRVLETRSP